MPGDLISVEDKHIVKLIACGDEEAYRQLFFTYHLALCRYSNSICRDREMASDVVQDVFFNIWRGRDRWVLKSSLKAYLYRSVRNKTLDYIRNKNESDKLDREEYLFGRRQQETSDESIVSEERTQGQENLVRQIWNCVERMPNERRQVFTLYRKHGLSYKEISSVLKVTMKTVEYHMSRALEDLRKSLDTDRLPKR